MRSTRHPNTFTWWLKQQYSNVEGLHLPTGASWLNQIELYFSVLSRKALAGESFASVSTLRDRLAGFEDRWNRAPAPIDWTYTSEQLAQLLEDLPATA
ncbi:transposase [Natrialbaceae archaeon A-gly3]